MIELLGIGLFVAVLLYPFLHEAGHSICAIIFGAKVVDFTLFPLPSILCNVTGVGEVGIACISVSGMLFPIFVSFLISGQRFGMCYTRMLLRMISALAFAISAVSVLLHVNPQDDMFHVMKILICARWTVPLFCGVIAALMIVLIVREKPLTEIMRTPDK